MKNLTLAQKLYFAFAAILILVAMSGVFAISRVSAVHDIGVKISDGRVPKVDKANDIVISAGDVERLFVWLFVAPQSETKKIMEEIEGAENKVNELLKFMEQNTHSKVEVEIMAKLKDVVAKTFAADDEVLSLLAANQREPASQKLFGLRDAFQEIEKQGEELAAHQIAEAQREAGEAKAIYEFARNSTIAITLLLVLLGGVLAATIVRSVLAQLGRDPAEINEIVAEVAKGRVDMKFREDNLQGVYGALHAMVRNLTDKAKVLEAVSQGDLTRDVPIASEQDVLGKSLQKMSADLNKTMSEITETANQVASAAGQVSTASTHLSEGATTQAASVEEISAAVNDMTSQAKNNASKAGEASGAAISSQQAAEKGREQITSTLTAMNEISASSQQISKVIKLIDDIAFQTNLLALNAAVEAARAGKHGKGFAVVADEVRNLAGRSAKAAKETSEMIESSIQKVENGVKQAESTAASFQTIADGAVAAATVLREIVDASNAQATAANQVAQALNGVSQVTQQNTATAEENAAAAEEMSSMAAQLKSIVGGFQIRKV